MEERHGERLSGGQWKKWGGGVRVWVEEGEREKTGRII
jgi:hypothetical protein